MLLLSDLSITSQRASLSLRRSLLDSPTKGGPSTLETVISRYMPILSKILDQAPAPYRRTSLLKVERASAAALDADHGLLRLRGFISESAPAILWGAELNDKAADALDVTCGLYGLPGLTDGSSVFAALVKAAESNTRIIASEPLRAAIAFKWAQYCKRQWLLQVLTYGSFVAGYVGGTGLLLLGDGGVGATLGGQARAHAPHYCCTGAN